MPTPAPIPEATSTFLAAFDERAGAEVRFVTRYASDAALADTTSWTGVARGMLDGLVGRASSTLASALPREGWLVATEDTVHVHKVRSGGGAGERVGTMPRRLLADVTMSHDRRSGDTRIYLTFADGSEAVLVHRTPESFPALGPWVRSFDQGSPVDQRSAEQSPLATEAVEEGVAPVDMDLVHLEVAIAAGELPAELRRQDA